MNIFEHTSDEGWPFMNRLCGGVMTFVAVINNRILSHDIAVRARTRVPCISFPDPQYGQGTRCSTFITPNEFVSKHLLDNYLPAAYVA